MLFTKLIKSVRNINNQSNKKESLTKRETELLLLFADGFTNSEIAEKLFISIRTVESHKNHIMQKLNLKSSIDMIKFAIKEGLISI